MNTMPTHFGLNSRSQPSKRGYDAQLYVSKLNLTITILIRTLQKQ